MDTTHAKKMMDAFYKGKRIRDQLPPLPEGILPSYINLLDAIAELSADGNPVRVSDIAKYRSLPLPGVTRTLREMEDKGLIEKRADDTDKRVVHIAITDRGEHLREKYVLEYFGDLTEKIPDVSDEEIDRMAEVINKVGKVYGL